MKIEMKICGWGWATDDHDGHATMTRHKPRNDAGTFHEKRVGVMMSERMRLLTALGKDTGVNI